MTGQSANVWPPIMTLGTYETVSMRLFVTLALLLAIASEAVAQGTKADYERAASVRQRFAGKVLNSTLRPTWFEDGAKFWYDAERPDGKKEWIVVDVATGTKSTVKQGDLPKEAKPDSKSPPRSSTNDRPPFPSPRSTSPDGQRTAFVRDHNLWLRDSKTKEESQLSSDGKSSDSYSDECYWSPDSTKLVAMRRKPGGDRKVTIVESSPRDQVQPKVMTYNYLKPGDPIAQSRPMLFDVTARKEIVIEDRLFKNPWELGRVRWDEDGKRFTFFYNQRGHQVVRVIGVDAASGKAVAIINEECDTFFDYSNKTYFRHLANGDMIWMSERSGWNHLYRINGKSGEVKNAITKGDWVVRGVDRVDEDKQHLWLRIVGYVKGEDPYLVHHARVNFDGTGFTLLDEGNGTHELQWSPDRKHFIDTYSRLDAPPRHVLRNADGKVIVELETADISALKKLDWRPPELFALPGRDGKTPIYGYILRPTHIDPKRKYPVIEDIYAGPHSHFVTKEFRPILPAQSMAELGFIVVKMDGMGTNWRSRAFHDVAWRNLADSGLPDRVAVIKSLATRHPEMDLSKGVGIFGGSAGGQSAMAGLLHHGDFYTVGVADCGCHDNRMDKIWWNEAWMGLVGPHYAEQSNVTNAHKLQGKLMLIVGELDTNVDPASTMQVVNALVKADKDFDLLVMPGVGHGAAGHPYANRRQQDFFVRNLLGVEPRAK